MKMRMVVSSLICLGVVSASLADVVALKASNGKYFQVRDDNLLYANATSVGTWEKFERGWTSDGYMYLISLKNNKYIQANCGTSPYPLRATSAVLRGWERFTREGSDASAKLKAYNAKYLCADQNLSMTQIVADRSSAGGWETFEIIKQGSNWVETWRDNFDGTSLNRNNWYVVTGTEADFNNEQQWYVDEEGVDNNFWVSGGTLCIKVQKETRTFGGKTRYYTSGRLMTKAKVSRQKGAWEARICFWKHENVQGMWPAFWLLGARLNEAPVIDGDYENVCWPLAGANEIDIWEYYDRISPWNSFITNNYSGTSCQQGNGDRLDKSDISPYNWNTYRVEWYDGNLKYFVNGSWIRNRSESPYTDPMFCILNVAVGGNLGGTVNWPTGGWAGITVDWVKHEAWN